MDQAMEMIASIDEQARRKRDGFWYNSRICGPDWEVVWDYGDRRCADALKPHVLTIKHISFRDEADGVGLYEEFIKTLLYGTPAPRIPLSAVMFETKDRKLVDLLQRLGFHKQPVTTQVHHWHAATGQKELPL